MASPTTPTDERGTNSPRIIRPLVDFLHKEASAGILIIIAAIIAIIWANSPWHESYHDLWNAQIGIDVGGHLFELNLRQWINDLAMVLFFFVVGLEIKREITEGELRDPRQAVLPVIGAIGGMVVPAAIFALLNAGGEGARGWGIPMATDIAIVIGIVTLLGSRAPSWAKIFLLALAIVDDIGAIIVIAVFYSDGVSFIWLAIAIGSFVLAALIKNHVPFIGVYVAIGGLCWFALHEAHIHPTLAGVAFGLLAPVRPRNNQVLVDENALAEHPGYDAAFKLSRQAKESVSIVEWLEHRLHPWSAFVIVPIFALANAGVRIEASEIGGMATNAVTWGVILGLVVGKMIGISAFTLLAVALKVARLPKGVTPRYVIAAGALGGIGFTVSLFVTELAFGESNLAEDARLGVVVASLAAALIGSAIMVPGHVDED
jgi:NhaA family Na+:H+ antiporter